MAKLNRIRIVLAEHDLNNKWLADKLGKDQATISKWVTNTTQPSLEALIAIANALETKYKNCCIARKPIVWSEPRQQVTWISSRRLSVPLPTICQIHERMAT